MTRRPLALAAGRFGCLSLGLVSLAGAAHAQTARDSAGIRIIENTRPVWAAGQEWRVSPKPIVDIGGGGRDYEFTRIAGVARAADGRIIVADEKTLELRDYD